MSLIPLLANGYSLKPSEEQLRARVLHATSLNLRCCGVQARVSEGKNNGLNIQIVRCFECSAKLRNILGPDATFEDVNDYLVSRVLNQIGIMHSTEISKATKVTFLDDVKVKLSSEFPPRKKFSTALYIPELSTSRFPYNIGIGA